MGGVATGVAPPPDGSGVPGVVWPAGSTSTIEPWGRGSVHSLTHHNMTCEGYCIFWIYASTTGV